MSSGNRVKAITSQFEVLSEKCTEKSPKNSFDAVRSNSSGSNRYYNNAKEKFGPSCNFGNRKRLKSTVTEEENESRKGLSRQHSDPAKKLHRTPAFRCERSEKLKENGNASNVSNNSSNNDSVENNSASTKDKLKRLGHVIGERLREDEMAFSQNEDLHRKAIAMNIKKNEPIPQHILDMYAKVLKPTAVKGYFGKCSSDVVFSDSGVSSESENLISDDLEDLQQEQPCDKEVDEFLLNKNVEAVPGVVSVETLKKVLKQPLPSGPPPKKPPRTFAATNVNNPNPKTKPHRSKEESKIMLDKIEDALMRHQKIIAPRKLEAVADQDSSSKKKEEVHYMCTEILDLHPNLNASDASSVASSSEDSSPVVVTCFPSLNCSSNNRHSAGFSYSKFGANQSCCSCNNSINSSSTVKLSTFSSPNSSSATLTMMDSPPKCKVCGLNEKRDDRFKCHLECTCKESTFFVQNPYGALKKSKSQEHIYDEPVLLRSSSPEKNFATVLPRSKTQLEDFFEKYKRPDDDDRKTVPFVRNDFRSKTVGRIKSGDRDNMSQSRAKDILKRWEESKDLDLFDGAEAAKSTKIADKDDDSATYKKPPMYDKKISPSSAIIMRMKRPQNLDLDSKRPVVKNGLRHSPVEIDKQNLNSLISEIYDTVTAACKLESPVDDHLLNSLNNIEKDFHKEYREYENVASVSGANQQSENVEASLKLTRKLTEKRKEYVRRVSCRTHDISSKQSGRVSIRTVPGKENFRKIKSMFENDNIVTDAAENRKKIEIPRVDNVKRVENRLFEACAVVGWNFGTGQAYIKSVFPETATLPPQIEALVFPESYDENSTSNARNSSVYRRERCETLAEDSQMYSLILTNEEGRRSYAYCRRVVPEGAPFCLPLAYCIITNFKSPSLYYKILEQIESLHGSSDVIMKSTLNQLYNENFPKPGIGISFKQWTQEEKSPDNFQKKSLCRSSLNLGDVLKFASKSDMTDGHINESEGLSRTYDSSKPRRKSADLSSKVPTVLSNENMSSMVKSLEKIYNGQNSLKKDENKKKSTNKECFSDNHKDDSKKFNSLENVINGEKKYNGFITLKRPLESRIEEDSLSILFNTLNEEVLLKAFGTLLLERKIIIVGDKLSILSACIEGFQSILYPFVWQHTLISTIPSELRKMIFEAPIPIIAGVYCPQNFSQNSLPKKHGRKSPTKSLFLQDLYEDLEDSNFDEGMIIDITTNKKTAKEQILRSQKDEATILPPALSKTLHTAFQLCSHISTVDTHSNTPANKSSNILMAESFLRFFTTFLCDFKKYLTDKTGSAASSEKPDLYFDKEKFIKNANSKHNQLFLEWFTETSMFKNFIRHQISINLSASNAEALDDLPFPDFYEVFNEKMLQIEINKKMKKDDSNAVTKGNYKTVINKRMKGWRDKFKDLIH